MKKTIILVSSILGLVAIFFIVDFLTSPIKDVSSKVQMQPVKESKMDYVPTKSELVKNEGPQLRLLGFYEVAEIKFGDHPYITLLNEEHGDISFAITILNKEKKTFIIPAIQFAPQDLHESDTFGLAKKDTRYFAYKNDYPIDDTTAPTK